MWVKHIAPYLACRWCPDNFFISQASGPIMPFQTSHNLSKGILNVGMNNIHSFNQRLQKNSYTLAPLNINFIKIFFKHYFNIKTNIMKKKTCIKFKGKKNMSLAHDPDFPAIPYKAA